MVDVRRSSTIIAVGTTVSRLLGFAKLVMLTLVIGQTGSQAAAAFGLANQLPNNVYLLVAGGLLSAVLVPQIVKASKSADNGQAYVSKMLTLGGTVFILLAAAATVAAPLLVDLYSSSDFGGRDKALAIALAYWCMPQILFYALYTLIGEVFNARGKFGPFTWAPVVNNVVAIAGLAVFLVLFGGEAINEHTDVWGPDRIALLGGVTTLGVAVQALVLIVLFRKTGLQFRLDFGWRGVGLRATGTKAMWLFGVVIIGQLKGLFQSIVVTQAQVGDANLANMQNAWYVFSLPHSVIAVSIAIAYFTRMSTDAAAGNLDAIRRDLSGALRGVGMLTTFAALALAVIAPPFWRLFDSNFEKSMMASMVLWAMLICLVAYSAEYVMQRVFFALDDTRTAFLYSLFGMVVTFTLLWFCMGLPSSQVVVGASLAVSIANLVSCTVWVVLVRRKIGSFGLPLIAKRHMQYLAYAALAAAAGFGIVWLFGGYRDGGFGTDTMGGAFTTCAVAGIVMAAIYFGLLYLTKNPDFRSTTEVVLTKFRRGSARTMEPTP